MPGHHSEEIRNEDSDDDNHDGGENHPSDSRSKEDPSESSPAKTQNKGKLILIGTCAPANIAYPTDLGLLNKVREKLEHIIDVLHEPHKGKLQKPWTYRKRGP